MRVCLYPFGPGSSAVPVCQTWQAIETFDINAPPPVATRIAYFRNVLSNTWLLLPASDGMESQSLTILLHGDGVQALEQFGLALLGSQVSPTSSVAAFDEASWTLEEDVGQRGDPALPRPVAQVSRLSQRAQALNSAGLLSVPVESYVQYWHTQGPHRLLMGAVPTGQICRYLHCVSVLMPSDTSRRAQGLVVHVLRFLLQVPYWATALPGAPTMPSIHSALASMTEFMLQAAVVAQITCAIRVFCCGSALSLIEEPPSMAFDVQSNTAFLFAPHWFVQMRRFSDPSAFTAGASSYGSTAPSIGGPHPVACLPDDIPRLKAHFSFEWAAFKSSGGGKSGDYMAVEQMADKPAFLYMKLFH